MCDVRRVAYSNEPIMNYHPTLLFPLVPQGSTALLHCFTSQHSLQPHFHKQQEAAFSKKGADTQILNATWPESNSRQTKLAAEHSGEFSG